MTEIQETALTESRTLRDQYAGRTDVLDKVKALSLLPDGVHVTTDTVAVYYEVDVNTVEKLVQRNREELEVNGRRVLKGAELRKFETDNLSVSNRRSLALFTRRAVLNVGQLLTESSVAAAVRTYLLDVEAAGRIVAGTELDMLEQQVERTQKAIAIARRERARADHYEQRAEVAEGTVREIEGANGLTIRMFHKKYFSDVREGHFFEHLYVRGYLIDQRGKGAIRPDGTVRDGAEHRHPSYKGKPYLYLHFGGVHGGKRRESTRVRPGQPELDFKAALVRDGLQSNGNDDGGLFAIPGGGA